ncbi:MAG TPA: trigger factor [Candidatus Deferrimicrobiaceae bacterium]|jgi:trigger factor
MKTSIEAVSGIEKKITVEVPAEEVAKRIEEGFVEVRKMVPVRGFRPGKAPMSMVKRLYKDAVQGDVAEKLVRETLAEAVKTNDLRVLSMPRVDGAEIVDGADFTYTAVVEVTPDVEPKDYKGIPVAKEKVEVTDADVEASVARIREAYGRYEPVESRGAASGDLVEIAYVASEAGEQVESKDSLGVLLEGGVPFGKEFEEKLTGVKTGDHREFEIVFPADSPADKFAGKTVAFKVTVNGIKEKKLPALDDELAKNFPEVATLDELRARLRERLVAEGNDHARQRAEDDIRKGLLAKNEFEIPKTLIDRQTRTMIEDTARRLASQGVDLRQLNMDFNKMKERFEPGAADSVRVSLLLEAIGKKETIDVSYPEMEAEMKEMATGAGMAFEKVREIYGDEERLDHLRMGLMERKVMQFLIDNATESKEAAK